MSYTPPADSFVDNPTPIGGGVGPSLNAAFLNALTAGIVDADTRLGLLERNIILPEQYGAEGDGATDDTGALAAALVAASTTAQPIMLRGTYLFSSLLHTGNDVSMVWLPGAKLLCSLSKSDNVIPVRIVGSRVRLINPTVDYTTTVSVDEDAATRPTAADTFRLGGNSAGAPADDIEVVGGLILNSRSTPMRIRYAARARVHRLRVQEALGNGIAFEACRDSSVTSCHVRRIGDDGIVVLASEPDFAAGRSRNILVTGNNISQVYANGVNYTGVDGGIIGDNIIEDTWAPGVRVWHDVTFNLGTCRNIQIRPNIIRNPGRYYGPGKFQAAVMAVPVGVYCYGGVDNVTLHEQTVINPEGADISIVGGGVNRTQPTTPQQQMTAGRFLGPTGVTVSSVVATLNRVTYTPIVVTGKATAANLNVQITAAAGGSTVRLGLYADTGGGQPGALIAAGGTVADSATSGMKTLTVAAAPLTAGTYWLAGCVQGGTPTLNVCAGRSPGMPSAQNPATNINGWYQDGVGDALPVTAGISGQTSSAIAITLGI